jgi:hypothetical protein
VGLASTLVTREVENKMSFDRVTSEERVAGCKKARVPRSGRQN